MASGLRCTVARCGRSDGPVGQMVESVERVDWWAAWGVGGSVQYCARLGQSTVSRKCEVDVRAEIGAAQRKA